MTQLRLWLYRLPIALILCLGALTAIARLGAPLLQHARQPLADWAGTVLGTPVEIGGLQASWYGLAPRLYLQQVAIGEGEQRIRLASAEIDLVPAALFDGQPLNALRLTLDGLQLHLLRTADGHIEARGLGLQGGGEASLPQTLPRRLRLRNTRLDWQDLRAGGKHLTLDDIDLEAELSDTRLRLRAALRSKLGDARFAADLAWPLSADDWSGSSYFEARGLALEPLFAAYLPQHYRVAGGRLQARIWQHWEHARPVDTQGELALREMQLANTAEQAHRVDLQQVSGNFHFRRDSADAWQLAVDGLQLQLAGQPTWPAGHIAVARRRGDDGSALLDAAVQHLQLGALADLMQIRSPAPALAEALQGLQPQGALHDLRLTLPLQAPQDWAASGTFTQLGWQAWQQVPGAQGLAGSVAATASHTSLEMDSDEVALDAPTLMRAPLQLTRLRGDLHWLHDDQGWRLLTDALTIDTPHLGSVWRLAATQQAGRPLHLDLIADLHDGDVSAVSQYLPAQIMGQELVQWLDRSLTRGRVERATVLISGPLEDFPYDTRRSGAFEVVAIARDTPLDYQVGWPGLKHVDARLAFHENSLDIDLLQGRIYDSRIVEARATIDTLDPTSPLRMHGKVAGPLADPVQLLGEPALSDDFGHIARTLKVKGDSELELAFTVPLVKGRGSYRLDGELRFLGAGMSLPEWDLAVSDIRGALKIGLDAVRARNIRGVGMGTPLSVDVTPQKDGSTRVSASGKLQREAIAQQLPSLPLHLVDGAAQFRIDVDFPGISAGPDAPTRLAVHSDLQGMRIDLPAPLGKRADDQRPLDVSLSVSGRSLPIRIAYDAQLSAAFSADGRRGEVRYARGRAEVPDDNSYRILASLPLLDVDEWQAAAALLGGGDADTQVSWRADIGTDMLRLGSLDLPRTALALEGDRLVVQGGILGERLTGRFRYPRSGSQPLTVQLSKAYLSMDTGDDIEGGSDPAASEPPGGPDPRQLPPLQLEIGELRLNRAPLGRVLLNSEKTDDGLRIRDLTVEGPSGALHAGGSWTRSGDTPVTHLHGKIRSPDLGTLLEGLGYPRNVRQAAANGEFDLTWPGHPGQPTLASIDGHASLALSEGRLAQVDPGLTRVLGLLSLDALGRRLKLDFGDVTEKGYSFDRIQGSFRFEDGQAYTNDLTVNGPSGRIEVGGRIGLVERDFDQVVSVTPEMDSTLPLASTLAGGPVAGVATLLAQELLTGKVDQINRFEYSVTGSWEEPQLTALDSGGALSRIVNTVTGKKTEAKTEQQEDLLQPSEEPRRGVLRRLLDAVPGLPDGDSAEQPSGTRRP